MRPPLLVGSSCSLLSALAIICLGCVGREKERERERERDKEGRERIGRQPVLMRINTFIFRQPFVCEVPTATGEVTNTLIWLVNNFLYCCSSLWPMGRLFLTPREDDKLRLKLQEDTDGRCLHKPTNLNYEPIMNTSRLYV